MTSAPAGSRAATAVGVEPTATTAPIVRMTGMRKSFGATQALRQGDIELLGGQVHAIVGENGSGKSTLVKLLSGVHRPDGGTIEIAGQSVTEIASPRAALAHGVGTVFQEILGFGARSVLENLWAGADGFVRNRLSQAEKRERGREVLAELMGRTIDLDTPLEYLSLSDRQTCAIARTLLRRPRVLVLDEATSALDVETRDRLFAVVRRVCAQGAAVVLISHRMDEIEEIADVLTVMRNGTTVARLNRGEWDTDTLVRLMTGAEELTDNVREKVAEPVARRSGDVVLRTADLRLDGDGEPIDIELRAGEIIGLAGLEGHGQDLFLRALWGADTHAHGAVVRIDGSREVVLKGPRHAARHGVVYVPRDRGAESIFPSMSIRDNFALPTLERDRTVLLSPRRSRRRLEHYVDRMGIVLGDVHALIGTLSGGNQQKVILSRWLAAEPRVLLLNDPTRGVDVNAKRDIYRLLADLTNGGMAVVMLSTELDEHVELMDRVMVFRENAVARTLVRDELDRETLVAAFFGAEVGADA